MDVLLIFYRTIGPAYLVAALAALNFGVFAAFALDKARAERGGWRVREESLLFYAAIGGTPGAYAARALFRHKTRKQPFSGRLHTIAWLQLAVLAGLALWRAGIWSG